MWILAAALKIVLGGSAVPISPAPACPAVDDVAQAARHLGVPATELEALLPTLSVQETPQGFDVVAAGQTRTYVDTERDCERRARWAAAFVALVATPAEPSEPLPPVPPPPPAPTPPAPLTLPAPPLWHVSNELSIDAVASADVSSAAVGGLWRIAIMRARWGAAIGVGSPYRQTATLDVPVRVRQRRWPLDVAVRWQLRPTSRAWDLVLAAGLGIVHMRDMAFTPNGTGAQVAAWQTGFKVECLPRVKILSWLWAQAAIELTAFPAPVSYRLEPEGRVGTSERLLARASLGFVVDWPPLP